MIKWLRRLLGGVPETGEWAVSAGDENGQPVVVRTRTRAPKGMASEAFPTSIEIVWRFDEGAQGGMPPTELAARMAECENVLGALEGPANGLLGMTITGNGRREWVWYVADADEFSARAQDLLKTSGGRFPLEVRSASAGQ